MSKKPITFGDVLGWKKEEPKHEGWYGKLSRTLRHVHKATGYKMATEGSRKTFSSGLLAHINHLTKNSTRKQISTAYEMVVVGLSAEVTALDYKLWETQEELVKQEREGVRLTEMNRDMGHREMKALDRENQAKRKTEALLILIAETTKETETVDEYGNVITPTGGW